MEDHPHRGVRAEGQAARHHLVENDPQRVKVGAAVDLRAALAHRLLGRDVLGRAHHHPRLGGRVPLAGVEGPLLHLRDPEVEDLDDVAAGRHGEEDVVGLDVAVRDPDGVGGGEGRAHLPRDRQRSRQGQGAVGADHLAQAPPVDVFHDDERPAVLGGVEVLHAHRVGVLELPRHHRFGPEPLQEVGVVGELGTDELYGHDLAEGQMLGAVDGGHPAGADLFEDLVLAPDHHSGDELGGVAERALIAGTDREVVRVRRVTVVAVFHVPASANSSTAACIPLDAARRAAIRSRQTEGMMTEVTGRALRHHPDVPA